MIDASVLFAPYDLAGEPLNSRIVMAPLGRKRATPDTDASYSLNAMYYKQRATAALIISESTQISPTAKGYAGTPGIYSKEQIAGWKLVTDAVHSQGARIFAQLWHVGRISHPFLQPHGQLPVAPSAIAPPPHVTTVIRPGEFVAVGTPRALRVDEIKAIILDYQYAAQAAIHAGFDGVEIHSANGYLIQQFMSSNTNHRNDEYGGSVRNRLRFPLDIVHAVIQQVGARKTGIRLSPLSTMNGIESPCTERLYTDLIEELNQLNLAYIHMIEGTAGSPRNGSTDYYFQQLRAKFKGTWIVNNGYDRELAINAIASGYADLVAFGRPFIANPDLVYRLKNNLPWAQPDSSTYYGGGVKGYTDYPCYDTIKI